MLLQLIHQFLPHNHIVCAATQCPVLTLLACTCTCRAFMTELLFEGYSVPALSYGIDALFSAHHHWSQRGLQFRDALIVSSGHQTTHIIPVLDGWVDTGHCKRYGTKISYNNMAIAIGLQM